MTIFTQKIHRHDELFKNNGCQSNFVEINICRDNENVFFKYGC